MGSPYTRLLDQPKKPTPKIILVLSYISTALIMVVFGVFIVLWKWMASRSSTLREVESDHRYRT